MCEYYRLCRTYHAYPEWRGCGDAGRKVPAQESREGYAGFAGQAYDLKQAQLDAERRDDRRAQVGGAERSEKIRTYNFPQCRITDHRIGLSLYSLPEVVNGDLDQVIEPLVTHYQTEALKSGTAQ